MRAEQSLQRGRVVSVSEPLDVRDAGSCTRNDGIEAVRKLLPICKFNEQTTEEGIEALQAYERVYDEQLKNYKDTPLHNWASHGADAMRYLAVMWDVYKDLNAVQPTHDVISTSGKRHRKGGKRYLPPLVMGGQVRRNGQQYR